MVRSENALEPLRPCRKTSRCGTRVRFLFGQLVTTRDRTNLTSRSSRRVFLIRRPGSSLSKSGTNRQNVGDVRQERANVVCVPRHAMIVVAICIAAHRLTRWLVGSTRRIVVQLVSTHSGVRHTSCAFYLGPQRSRCRSRYWLKRSPIRRGRLMSNCCSGSGLQLCRATCARISRTSGWSYRPSPKQCCAFSARCNPRTRALTPRSAPT